MKDGISLPPIDATLMYIDSGYRRSGGYYTYNILFFKKIDEVWYIYDSDSDNEYPSWRGLAGNGLKWFVNNKIEEYLTSIPEQLKNSTATKC